MPSLVSRLAVFTALSVASGLRVSAQEAKPAAEPASGTLSVSAKLVVVPVVVLDKKGLVTNLQQGDFAISVDNKPQTVRYFDHDRDAPLTVGLLVDVSRSQTSVLDEEQKASDRFLESFLEPVSGKRPADKAFVLQFAHTAELLQDVTDSRPLLAAGLKEIGTQAPGAAAEDTQPTTDTSNSGSNPNSSPNSGNRGGYGRRGGYPGGSNGGGDIGRGSQARGGTVLYDSVFLASDDVLHRQTGRLALVILTDGVDRHSKESLTEAIEAAQRSDVVVYAIYYKGREPYDFSDRRPYDRNGMPRTPGSGGNPGSDGTYGEPDGRKILERICGETGGRMFQVKGKGSIDEIYKQIGDELRAQYRLGFTPTAEAASAGFHPLDVSLTNPASRKLEIQTRQGYYTGEPKSR